MKSERVTFPGHTGEALAARLDLPDGPAHASAILAHCFTCSKDIPAARRIALRLAQRGIAVLRFDFTGLGHSAGEFANTNFSSNVEDLVLAAEFLAGQGMPAQLIIGHSLGGAAVLKAAPQIATLRAVVTIGAPAEPAHVAHNFGGQLEDIRTHGSARVKLSGREFEIKRQFVEDIEGASLLADLPRLGRALLVMHAPRDTQVGIENAAAIFTAARHPKSFVTLDDADHLITRAEDADYAADIIAAWSSRYLDTGPVEPLTAPERVVRAVDARRKGLRQNIAVGARHRLISDEPLDMGGTDLGPSPYELVSAGLAACTSITLRMYASRKDIPLEGISVDVTHAKRDAGDAGSKIDHFRREITLTGELTAEQRAKLLEIAGKCPVHRTLEAEAQVETILL